MLRANWPQEIVERFVTAVCVAAGDSEGAAVVPEALARPDAIFCAGGREPLDDCAASIVAALLSAAGGGVKLETSDALAVDRFFASEIGSHGLICICFLGAPRTSRIRYIARRIRRKAPATPILICVLGDEAFQIPRDLEEAGVEVVVSLAAAIGFAIKPPPPACLSPASANFAEPAVVGSA